MSTLISWRAAIFLAATAVVAATSCGKADQRSCGGEVVDAPGRGGVLVVGLPGEPHTWNRILATDQVTHTVTEQLHAGLVRINRLTQEVEPALAESWAFSGDGRWLTFKLRSGVRFSDGAPFTAEDVAFSFRALHDPKVASPLVETAMLDGVPLTAEVVEPLVVRFRLPRRTAVVERLFDSLAILPRHRLASALEAGGFASEYGPGAPVESIVGLGPFALERYFPGQRVVLKRNPYYWKKLSGGEGLPFLDGIIFEVVTDANAAILLRAGELDLLERIPADDFLTLKASGRADLRVIDVGEGLATEKLWFNLNPRAGALAPEKRGWFSEESFRRAVSLAIDRSSIVEGVYRGLASVAHGPVPGANTLWSNRELAPFAFDQKAAGELLTGSGFRTGASGKLLDRKGRPVHFSLLTNSGNPLRQRTAALIQEDLARIGVDVDVVTHDFPEVVARFTRTFDYDAVLFGINVTDPDPSAQLPFWQSRSPLHVWHPSQSRPSTAWEARVDELMEKQMLALDAAKRKKLFDEVQTLVVEHLPVMDLVVPHVLIGAGRTIGGLKPTPLGNGLWNSEEIYLPCEIAGKP